MSNEAIERIRQAETEAESIRKKAEYDAAAMISASKEKGERMLAITEEKTRAEIAEMKKTVCEKSDKLIAKSRFDAKVESAELRKNAKMKMRAAADEILRGIDKQCQ